MRTRCTLFLALVTGLAWGQPGTLDSTWNTGGSGPNYYIFGSAGQPDGKVIMGGNLSTYNGTGCDVLIRMNPDGTQDTGFDTGGFGPATYLTCLVLQPDGKVIVGGNIYSVGGINRRGIVRLNSDGSVDTGFDPGTGFATTSGFTMEINTLALQADGKVLVGGRFNVFNGMPANYLARLNSDGSLDSTFQPTGSGVEGEVKTIAPLTDGRILIGGDFASYNGSYKLHIARLFSDGTLDADFHTSANNSVGKIITYPSGRILISGRFTLCNGTPRRSLAVLNPNGHLVADLDPAALLGPNGSAGELLRLPGNRTLVAGSFNTNDGAAKNGLMVIKADGTADLAFNPGGAGTTGGIYTMCTLADGKIFIAGDIYQYNGVMTHNATRLNGYGTGGGMMPQEERSLAAGTTTRMALWPNPACGSSAHLLLDQLDPAAQVAHVSLADITGKVLSRMDFPVVDGHLDTELELNSVTDGMYMLQIMAGGSTRTERLVIRR